MGAVFGLGQVKLGPSGDDDPAMVNEFLKQGLEPHDLGLDSVGQRQDIVMEGFLKLGIFEKLVEDLPRESVLLEVYGDAHPFAVRLVADIPDTVDVLVFEEFGHVNYQLRLV
jgi:hypothetical protein